MSDSRRSNDSAMKVERDFDKDVKPRLDNPPNSRLFIVCNKNITEEEFQEAFEKYGNIEEIWVVRDRTTRKPKGVTYIKFSKTSEAALALEEMNGRRIGNHTRALKVMIAHRLDVAPVVVVAGNTSGKISWLLETLRLTSGPHKNHSVNLGLVVLHIRRNSTLRGAWKEQICYEISHVLPHSNWERPLFVRRKINFDISPVSFNTVSPERFS